MCFNEAKENNVKMDKTAPPRTQTPLLVVAQNGHVEVVGLLLAGA